MAASISVARLRYASGLVLFTYVLGHFINHALMIHSVELALQGQKIFTAPWKTPIGLVLLCGSCLIHMGLAFYSLARRRSFRMTRIEILQYLSGLSIPIIMAHHVSLSLLSGLENGTQINFFGMNLFHWVVHPTSALTTVGAILIVWVHACIGLHFNLKVRSFYEHWSPALLVLAVAVPLLSIAGHVSGGMASARQIPEADQAWLLLGTGGITQDIYAWSQQMDSDIGNILIALILSVLMFRFVRQFLSRRGPSLNIQGGRSVRIISGATILETLRENNIPHAAICGGRGRCTTCRVRISKGGDQLPAPSGDEAAALARIEAEDNVRLACQVRPDQDTSILPLLPVSVTMRQGRQRANLSGYEQYVTCLFIDLRGSTTLAQDRLPYDVLFILNQFFSEMSSALSAHRGHYAQFTGDGLMALFGLEDTPQFAARSAWECASDMLRRVDALNERLKGDLPFPLKIGVGIHYGVAIVGDIGPPDVRHISAIGDTINTTARLEAMCKTLDVPVVVSEIAALTAGVEPPFDTKHDVEVRGKDGTLSVYALSGGQVYNLLESANASMI